MESFDTWCLRIIAKIRLSDRVSNEALRNRCFGITTLKDTIRIRRLQWFGHVARRDNSVLTKQVLNLKPCPEWKCKLGGQTKTWLDTVKNDVDRLGLVKIYGLRRWKNDWVFICEDLANNRKA